MYWPHLVQHPAQFAVLHEASQCKHAPEWQTVRGIGQGAADARASKGKKRYNMGNRAGYSATLDAAGMVALNPRCGRNGTLLLDVSRRAHGGVRLCV